MMVLVDGRGKGTRMRRAIRTRSRQGNGWASRVLWGVSVALLGLGVAAPLWALDRSVRSEIENAPEAPVEVTASRVALVEKYATPVQAWVPSSQSKWSRVRYANRKGLVPSQLFLQGEASVVNRSNQVVEAVGVSVMPRNAFRQAMTAPGQTTYEIHQVEERLGRNASKRVRWEQPVNSTDVYEVTVSVIAVRFADGSTWLAPREFIKETFFR